MSPAVRPLGMLHCCEALRHATAALGSSDILLLLLLCGLEKTQSNTNTNIEVLLLYSLVYLALLFCNFP